MITASIFNDCRKKFTSSRIEALKVPSGVGNEEGVSPSPSD